MNKKILLTITFLFSFGLADASQNFTIPQRNSLIELFGKFNFPSYQNLEGREAFHIPVTPDGDCGFWSLGLPRSELIRQIYLNQNHYKNFIKADLMFFATEQRNDSLMEAERKGSNEIVAQLMVDSTLPNNKKELADLLLTLRNYPQLSRAVADVLLLKKERQEEEPRLRVQKQIEKLRNWEGQELDNRREITRKILEKLGNGTFSNLHWEGYWGRFTEEEIESLKNSFGSLHNARTFLDDYYFWQTKVRFGSVDFKTKTASLPRKISNQLSDERLQERQEKYNTVLQLNVIQSIKEKLKTDITDYVHYSKPQDSYFDLLSKNEINYLSTIPGFSRDFKNLRRFLEIPLNEQDINDIAARVRPLSPEDLPDEAFITFLIDYYKLQKSNGYLMYTDRSLAGGQDSNGFHEEIGGARAAAEILGVNVKVWKKDYYPADMPAKLSASPQNTGYLNRMNMLYNGYNHYDYLLFTDDRDEVLAHALWNAWHAYSLHRPVTEQTIEEKENQLNQLKDTKTFYENWESNQTSPAWLTERDMPVDNNDAQRKKAYYEKEIDKSVEKVSNLTIKKEIQDFALQKGLVEMLNHHHSPLLRLRPINHPPRLFILPFPKEELGQSAQKALEFDFQGINHEGKKQAFSQILVKAQEKNMEVNNTLTNSWVRAMDVIVNHTNPEDKTIGENFFKFFSSEQPTHRFRDRKTLGKAVSIVKKKARDLFVLSNYTKEQFKSLILGSSREEFDNKHPVQAVNTFIVSMLATGHKPSDTANMINSYYPLPHLMTPQKAQAIYDDLSSYEQ